jgi:hypothetical protein
MPGEGDAGAGEVQTEEVVLAVDLLLLGLGEVVGQLELAVVSLVPEPELLPSESSGTFPSVSKPSRSQ